jgi:hypothetical protein
VEFEKIWGNAAKSVEGMAVCKKGGASWNVFLDIFNRSERRLIALVGWDLFGYGFLTIFDGYAEQRGADQWDAFYKAKIAFAKDQAKSRVNFKGGPSSSSHSGGGSSAMVSSSTRYSGGVRYSGGSSSSYGNVPAVPSKGKGKSGGSSGNSFPKGSCFSCGSWEHWAEACPRPKQW